MNNVFCRAGVLVFCSLSFLVNADPVYDNYSLRLNNGELKEDAPEKFKLIYKTKRVPTAITNTGAGDSYYFIKSDGKSLYYIDLTTNQLLGNWPLERTADDSTNEVRDLYKLTTTQEQSFDYKFHMSSNPQGLGCLAQHPLRYGDLNLDGQQELVLLTGSDSEPGFSDRHLDFSVFSSQSHTVVFSARLAREDIGEPLSSDFASQPEGGKYPQIGSIFDARSPGHAAMRTYAKLFFGDFDADNQLDILVWRKRYQSRLKNDPLQGFELKKDLLEHYEFNAGDYKKQPTDQITVKNWLTTHNQTWKKGYPNNSECANQQNQLIPEMHDARLNDPDVLQ